MALKATISSVDEVKTGTGGQPYQRVYMSGSDGKFYITDVVRTFRNYKNWKDVMVPGLVLGNVRRRGEGRIDADSKPIIVNDHD